MNRKIIPGLVFVFFFLGLLGLFRFSQEIRAVDAIGLYFSGISSGAALVGLIMVLKGKKT